MERPSAVDDAVEAPGVFEAFQLVYAAVFKGKSRAHDEVLHRLRDEHLGWSCGGTDPGTDGDCHPSHLAVDPLAFTRVQPGPNFDSQRPNLLDDRLGTANCARRTIERGEEPIAGRVDLGSAIALEERPHRRVVAFDEFPPRAVAELGGFLRRADDVGEEDRGEDSLELRLLATNLTEEGVDRPMHRRLVANPEGRVDPRELFEPSPRNRQSG